MLRGSDRRLVLTLGLSFVVASAALFGCAESPEPSAQPPPAVACPDAVAGGAELEITAIPDDVPAAYGEIFCKYSEIIAPNGKPIRIFAQKEISNEQWELYFGQERR